MLHAGCHLLTFPICEHDIGGVHIPPSVFVDVPDLRRRREALWERLVTLLLEELKREKGRFDGQWVRRIAALIKACRNNGY